MRLSQYPALMGAAISSTLALGRVAREVRDTPGLLSISSINTLAGQLREAKIAAVEVLADMGGMADPTEAQRHMKSVSPFESAAEFGASVQTIEIAAQSWNVEVRAQLATLTVANVIVDETVGSPPSETMRLSYVTHLPEAQSAALRGSAGLAQMIAALEAVGA